MADTLTPRQKALQNLSNQLPVANARVAQGQQAARDMQLQQAVQKAPPTAGTATAQQTGAAVAQNAGQQMVQAAQQNVQQQGQIGQIGLQAQQQQAQANIAGQRQGLREQAMTGDQRFAQISEKSKQELYDNTMQFQRDEAGRTFFNERQLADYARLNAESDEQFKDYAQNAEQLSKRKLQTMEHAYKVATEDLRHKQAVAEQQKDQKSLLEINQIKKDMEERIQKERNKAANRSAAFTTGGMVIGTVVGAYFGGPAGAAAGGQAGSAVGGLAASQTQ